MLGAGDMDPDPDRGPGGAGDALDRYPSAGDRCVSGADVMVYKVVKIVKTGRSGDG